GVGPAGGELLQGVDLVLGGRVAGGQVGEGRQADDPGLVDEGAEPVPGGLAGEPQAGLDEPPGLVPLVPPLQQVLQLGDVEVLEAVLDGRDLPALEVEPAEGGLRRVGQGVPAGLAGEPGQQPDLQAGPGPPVPPGPAGRGLQQDVEEHPGRVRVPVVDQDGGHVGPGPVLDQLGGDPGDVERLDRADVVVGDRLAVLLLEPVDDL